MAWTWSCILALALTAAVNLVAAGSCPPSGFDSVPNFSIKKYIQGPWYIQEQVSTSGRGRALPWN